MNFEVGQKWVARNGSIFTIEGIFENHAFPVKARNADGGINTFTLGGFNASKQIASAIDLLYVLETKPKFEVGQTWESRCGDHIYITLIDTLGISGYYKKLHGATYRSTDLSAVRYLDGRMESNKESKDDLVKLVSPISEPDKPEIVAAIDDCECRMKKHGFTGHMQYCPDFKTMAQMAELADDLAEINAALKPDYMTDGDRIAMSKKYPNPAKCTDYK